MTLDEVIEFSKPIIVNISQQLCPKDGAAVAKEDLQQIGYLEVVRTHEKFSKITTGLIGYLARNSMIDYLRSVNKYSRTYKENKEINIGSELYDELIKYIPDNRRPNYRLDYDKIKELVKKLNDREQLVVNLYYFENWEQPDIGEQLNLSVHRIMQIKAEAVQKIRSFIKRDLFIEGKKALLHRAT